jgi:hypothetical protein
MDALEKKVDDLPSDFPDNEGQRAVACFKEAMERRASGKPDIGPFFLE